MNYKKRVTQCLTALVIVLIVSTLAACGNNDDQNHAKKAAHEKAEKIVNAKDDKAVSNKAEKSTGANSSNASESSNASSPAKAQKSPKVANYSCSPVETNKTSTSRLTIHSPAQACDLVKRKIGGGDENGPYVYSYMSNTTDLNGTPVYWIKGPSSDFYVDRAGHIYNESGEKIADSSNPNAPVVKQKQKRFVINNADQAGH